MASSAGGADDGDGRSSPRAAAPRTLVDDLIDVRERATMLQTMLLQGSPPPMPRSAAAARYASAAPEGTSALIDRIMSRLSSALSTLDTTGGVGGHQGQGQQGQGRRRGKGGVSGSGSGPQRRSNTRRRSHSPFVETITTSTLDDGRSWRKYGQKVIQESPNNPRSYYRCTHKPDQGCRATRQVQASDANPSEFVISYYGQHTCRDPSTIPLVIQDTTAPQDCANLISFGSSSTSTHTAVHPQAFDDDLTTTSSCFSGLFGGGYSCSLPAHSSRYRCGSEEVHSSSGPPAATQQQLAAVVGSSAGAAAVVSGSSATAVGSAGTIAGSSATVGSAPAEYWPRGGASDMACGPGTGSFPSSPSSLGFMTGSFGSFEDAGDDDLFGFEP